MPDLTGMSLDEYVRETLVAIVGGVVAAQSSPELGEFFGRSPQGKADHLGLAYDADDNTISMVKFDLATTVEDKRQSGGGFGIKVLPLVNASLEGKGEAAASLVSRLSFSVPVSIPKPSLQRQRDDARKAEQARSMRSTMATWGRDSGVP